MVCLSSFLLQIRRKLVAVVDMPVRRRSSATTSPVRSAGPDKPEAIPGGSAGQYRGSMVWSDLAGRFCGESGKLLHGQTPVD
jgi:hypothetical protein